MSFLDILLFSWPQTTTQIRGLPSAGHLIYQTNLFESPLQVQVLFRADKNVFMYNYINLRAENQIIQIFLQL